MEARKRKLAVVVITFITLLFMNSCQLSRYIVYNFADIKDYKIFSSRSLVNDSVQFKFYTTDKPVFPKKINKQFDPQLNKEEAFDTYLEKNKTVAFLIIKNDTIQYEKYFRGYDQTNIVPSFSMAKSVTSILIGCAIDDGLIKSVEEPVSNYIPELKKNGFDKVTLKHLLQMTSG